MGGATVTLAAMEMFCGNGVTISAVTKAARTPRGNKARWNHSISRSGEDNEGIMGIMGQTHPG